MAAPVFLKNNRSDQQVNGEVSTRVMACYDDSTLYIGFIAAIRKTSIFLRRRHLTCPASEPP
jgi:hypothetical protein